MEPKLIRRRRKITFLPTTVLQISLSINLIAALTILYLSFEANKSDANISDGNDQKHLTETKALWHGGHPAEDRAGSCWCGEDEYCLCSPNLAIDLIITSGGKTRGENLIPDYFWLVRRKDTSQLATMGGFVELHETVEDAVKRELMEEMSLALRETPELVGIYSDSRRDTRRRTASIVFAIHFPDDISPRAGDDAKDVVRISLSDVENHSFFSDHRTILLDYRSRLKGEAFDQYREETNFAGGVIRSTCGMSK